MANVLGGGQGSPSKSGEEPHEPRISPLGALLPPTQRHGTPESSAGKKERGAAEMEAMPPPPLPRQQQPQQQEQQQILLPTQPQNLSAGIDGAAAMEIDDNGPEIQVQDDDGERGDGGVVGGTTQPTSPREPANIAQLPITQPIPYGGTSPEALHLVASVQGEATHTGEEADAEEISPARGAVAAFLAERQQGQVGLKQRQEIEEEEEEAVREPLISPSARGWFESIKNFGLSKLPKSKHTPTPPTGGKGAGVGGSAGKGGGSGRKKAPTPVFGGAGFGTARRPLTEGLANAGRNVNSQSLLPTEAAPEGEGTEEVPEGMNNEDAINQRNNKDNLNTQETVIIDQDETGDDEQQQRRGTKATENIEINPLDQHLATSIDARLDAGGGNRGGGEGAASPERRPPFHQPSSVEAIDMEEEDGDVNEEGEVEEGAHDGAGGATAGDGGVRTTRGGLQSAAAAVVAAIPAFGGIRNAQRAASSVAQNGAHAAAAMAFNGGAATAAAGIGINHSSAFGIGLGGPLTQDFYGVTATQEDIEAILDNNGNDAGVENGLAAAGEVGKLDSRTPPAEPSGGPGNAILQGRDIFKNAARTTEDEDKELSRAEKEEEERGKQMSPEKQASPDQPIARRTRRRGAEAITAGAVQGIEYAKRRKMNPTKIVFKRTTRAAALAEEAAAATTGSTGKNSAEKISEIEGEDDDMEPDMQGGGDNGGNAYPSSSMPPPPVVLNPAIAAARDMPTPRAPTPAAQLPSRTLAAREKLHALMRQRQLLTAAPSAAGVGASAGGRKPAGAYQPAAGALRVAVHRPAGAGGGVASTGAGSGPNSNDYRTPMAGQTPVHSVLNAAGGGVAPRGRAYPVPQRPQQRQQQAPAVVGGGSAAGGTSDAWNRVVQQRQQRRLQRQQSAASGGAAKSTFSSLLGL